VRQARGIEFASTAKRSGTDPPCGERNLRKREENVGNDKKDMSCEGCRYRKKIDTFPHIICMMGNPMNAGRCGEYDNYRIVTGTEWAKEQAIKAEGESIAGMKRVIDDWTGILEGIAHAEPPVFSTHRLQGPPQSETILIDEAIKRYDKAEKECGEAFERARRTRMQQQGNPLADAVVFGTGYGKEFWGTGQIEMRADDVKATMLRFNARMDNLCMVARPGPQHTHKPGELIRLLVFNGCLT